MYFMFRLESQPQGILLYKCKYSKIGKESEIQSTCDPKLFRGRVYGCRNTCLGRFCGSCKGPSNCSWNTVTLTIHEFKLPEKIFPVRGEQSSRPMEGWKVWKGE